MLRVLCSSRVANKNLTVSLLDENPHPSPRGFVRLLFKSRFIHSFIFLNKNISLVNFTLVSSVSTLLLALLCNEYGSHADTTVDI